MTRRHFAVRRLVLLLLALLLAGAVVAGCGGDDGDQPSPQTLEGLLPPPSQLRPLQLERTIDWDNATDFIVQGTVLPQATAPSSAIGQMEDEGFAAGAGDILTPQGGGAPVNVDVAAFDSTDGAVAAQDYLHDQDLQQPCFEACAVGPQEMAINDIPGSTAVHQVPVEGKLPPSVEPFEAFAAEFTIGSDLFYAYASGDPGDIPPAAFERGVLTFYEWAHQHSD